MEKTYFKIWILNLGGRNDRYNQVKKATKASSVMIARGALENASIFSTQREDPNDVIRKYLMKVRFPAKIRI